jgi:hypothetical protein
MYSSEGPAWFDVVPSEYALPFTDWMAARIVVSSEA